MVMTICSPVLIEDNILQVAGINILRDVPSNVTVDCPVSIKCTSGAFVGAKALKASSSHTFSLGVLNSARFLSCFRFKLWWMTQRVGARGSDIPAETQFLLLEKNQPQKSKLPASDKKSEKLVYVVLLPLLDGAFRSALSGSTKDELMLTCHSGDPAVESQHCSHALYIHASSSPYTAISEAVRTVELHMQSFQSRDKKQLPGILDLFGWCTWDAFYTDVSVDGVHEGLETLAAGGIPARFLVIDDGWQSTGETGQEDAVVSVGTQYASRLTDIKENKKFKQPKAPKVPVLEETITNLGHVVQEIKACHDVKYVYVWHALMGYWGGVQVATKMAKYLPSLVYPVHTEGVLTNQPDMAEDSITVNGVGLVHPSKIHSFYDTMHAYLRSCGVDGVKVDAQSILETVGAGYGGRVKLAKVFHSALEASISKNFASNDIISCMSHSTDALYSAKQTAVMRASDDFWPRDPASHTIHVASVAYNSLFLGEFMQPDWDMFQSLHPAAEYHAAARAVGGCAVYVSDKPGQHDFALLRKLVLPDGSVLRARLPGRPTRDSLFVDPARDGESMLKIWNMNLCNGVLGAFNCQGAAWCKIDKKYAIHDSSPLAVAGSISVQDVDSLAQVAWPNWTGEAVFYAHRAQEATQMGVGERLALTLDALQYEVFTVAPLKVLSSNTVVAPIGLVGMFNAGGAILSIDYEEPVSENVEQDTPTMEGDTKQEVRTMAALKLVTRGSGLFALYTSTEPLKCVVDGSAVLFTFSMATSIATFQLPHIVEHQFFITITF